tara:strand:- start:12786 stop:14942 length:2157 start_codon:yes stop_codon:yes gene_type:complete
MFEIAGKEDLPEMKARRPKRAPSGFMEGLTASFKAEQMETDAWHRVAKTRASVFEDIEKSLMQKAGGKAVIEEAPNPKHRTNPTADRMKREERLLKLAQESGDTSLPWTRDAVEERTKENYSKEYQDAIETIDFMRNASGITEFFGRGGAAVTDQTSVMSMFVGGGTGSVARIVAQEAALGALGEAAVLPRQYQMAEYLDIPNPNPLAQIAMGAGFSGALAGGAKALTRGGRAQISDELRRAVEFASQRRGPWRVEDKAAVDAAEDAMASGEAASGPAAPVVDDIGAPAAPFDQAGDPGVMPAAAPSADPIEVGLIQEIDRIRAETGGVTRPIANWLKSKENDMPNEGGGISTFQIHPDGEAAAELRQAGVTSRTSPGLFSKRGRKSFDNLVASEMEERFPGITSAAGLSDDGIYLDQFGFLKVLAGELDGQSPLRSMVDLSEAEQQLEDYLRQRDLVAERFDPLPDSADVSELQDGMNRIKSAVDDHVNQFGLSDLVSPVMRDDIAQMIAERGGSVDDALDAIDAEDLSFARGANADGTEAPEGRFAARNDASYASQLRDGPNDLGGSGQQPEADGAGAGGQGSPGSTGNSQVDPGGQGLIEGVDPVTQAERLEAQLAEPLRGGDAPADEGLFDLNARNQIDMFDEGPRSKVVDDANVAIAQEMRASIEADGDFLVSMTDDAGNTISAPASKWLDDLEQEQDFVEIAELCSPNRSVT